MTFEKFHSDGSSICEATTPSGVVWTVRVINGPNGANITASPVGVIGGFVHPSTFNTATIAIRVAEKIAANIERGIMP